MIDLDLMPGGLIAALGAASVITNRLARRTAGHTRQHRLYTVTAGLNATGFAVSVAAVITEGSGLWVTAAIFFALGCLGSFVNRRIAREEAEMTAAEAEMTAAEAEAAARRAARLGAVIAKPTNPTKETRP